MEDIEKEELERVVGIDKVNIFYDIIDEIALLYDMDQTWNNGGKKWTYEYKFRKSGKTLCAFYFKENILGFMIIFLYAVILSTLSSAILYRLPILNKLW